MSGKYEDDDHRMMLELFYEIDANNNGEISHKELSDYMKKRGYTDADVEKYMKHFDENQDGKITMEEFVSKLDLHDDFFERPTEHDKDIECINVASTSFNRQYIMVNAVRRAVAKGKDDKKEVAKLIKNQLDSQLDKLWHCLMIKGQYWAFYSHEPENSMVFKFQNTVYILFRTPSM